MLMIVILLALIIFAVYVYAEGVFTTTADFVKYVESFGIWGILIFMLIQVITVVIPILPTSVGCIAAIIIFGPWYGFLYNYISICAGSVIDFLLSKHYGSSLVEKIIGKKNYTKYIGWCQSGKKFDKMFALAIFFPGAPDDALCYIAGLTKMNLGKFTLIILLGKPVSLVLYSAGLTVILHYLATVI